MVAPLYEGQAPKEKLPVRAWRAEVWGRFKPNPN